MSELIRTECPGIGKIKILMDVTLFRFGLKKFAGQLNALLEEGWVLDQLTVTHWGWFGLRLLLFARFWKSID